MFVFIVSFIVLLSIPTSPTLFEDFALGSHHLTADGIYLQDPKSFLEIRGPGKSGNSGGSLSIWA
jgi:hypothetical protein